MKLNHLDLQVVDVPETAAFLVRHFELELQSKASSPAIAILGDAGGFVLVLQRLATATYPEGFHFGFYVDEVAEVHARHQRMSAAGADVSAVIANNRGTMFYCRGPSGLVIEINCRRHA